MYKSQLMCGCASGERHATAWCGCHCFCQPARKTSEVLELTGTRRGPTDLRAKVPSLMEVVGEEKEAFRCLEGCLPGLIGG